MNAEQVDAPRVGQRVRIVKKKSDYHGYIGTIQEIIDSPDGKTFSLLVRDFCKDGSAIAPKVRDHEIERVTFV